MTTIWIDKVRKKMIQRNFVVRDDLRNEISYGRVASDRDSYLLTYYRFDLYECDIKILCFVFVCEIQVVIDEIISTSQVYALGHILANPRTPCVLSIFYLLYIFFRICHGFFGSHILLYIHTSKHGQNLATIWLGFGVLISNCSKTKLSKYFGT